MVNICWTEPFLWLWSHIALPRADWRPVPSSWLMGDHTLTLNTLYVRRCWHCNYSWTIWYTGGICFINFIHYAITIIQIKLLSSSRVSSWWTPWDFSYKSTGSHYRIGMLEVAFNFPFCCRFVFVMENIISVFEGPWPECWTFHSGRLILILPDMYAVFDNVYDEDGEYNIWCIVLFIPNIIKHWLQWLHMSDSNKMQSLSAIS